MNIAAQIGAVRRTVATIGNGHVVGLEQTFPHPATELWSALTEPARLAGWFETVEGELREGGRYRLPGSETEGTIARCAPPTTLRLSWEFQDDRSQLDLNITAAEAGSATLLLAHTVPNNDHWRRFGPAATGVAWDGSFLALWLYLAEDPRADPEEMIRFHGTSGGREFISLSAAAWESAHIHAGAPAAEAHEAAQRTAAFYSGDE